MFQVKMQVNELTSNFGNLLHIIYLFSMEGGIVLKKRNRGREKKSEEKVREKQGERNKYKQIERKSGRGKGRK